VTNGSLTPKTATIFTLTHIYMRLQNSENANLPTFLDNWNMLTWDDEVILKFCLIRISRY